MPRKALTRRVAATTKPKRTAKKAVYVLPSVAPTTSIAHLIAARTPVLPPPEPPVPPGLKLQPGTPSAHVVDLRAIVPPRRRMSTPVAASSYAAPRTLSERADRAPIWNSRAFLGIFAFIGYLVWHAVFGVFKLLALPLTAGLKLTDRHLDLDSLFGGRGANDEPMPVPTPAPTPDPIPTPVYPAEGGAPQVTRTYSWKRALLSFAGASLAFILPLQAVNTYRSLSDAKVHATLAGETGLSAFKEASNGTPDVAALARTGDEFAQAKGAIDEIGTAGNAILGALPGVGGQFRSGKALLTAGEDLANAASLLTSALGTLDSTDTDLTQKISKIEALAVQVAPLLDEADEKLGEVHDLPPGVSEATLATVTDTVRSLRTTLHGFIDLAPSMRDLLGETEGRRFLVLFQNNAEIRPTGGFTGSFAVIDVDRGRVSRITVPAGGPYELQGSLKARVLAPEPIRLINAKWEFQDANWFPDFPTSAQKLAWFYSQSGGPSVDGVIAVNAPVLAALLDAVGPVEMPEYGVTATSETVLRTAQEIVESDTARASGKPKQFIADLLPKVLDKVMTGSQATTMKTLTVFASALSQKDVQFYFTNESAQSAFDRRGWTGRVAALPAGFDGVEVVRTNIAGGKTDTVMDTRVTHGATVAADGTVTDTLTVVLTHTGKKGDPFTGVRNVTYLRAYVPQGSKLLSVTGDIRRPDEKLFDTPPDGYGPDQTLSEVTGMTLHDPDTYTAVNNEFGRTVFGNWLQTDPGQTSTITFTYTLPFNIQPTIPESGFLDSLGLGGEKLRTARYGILFGKQSGADRTDIISSLTLPEGWYLNATQPNGIANAEGWNTTFSLTADRAIGGVIAQP